MAAKHVKSNLSRFTSSPTFLVYKPFLLPLLSYVQEVISIAKAMLQVLVT
jgi:hypothetical protein